MRVYSNTVFKPVDIQKVCELVYCGLSANQIAREIGASAPAIYGVVKRLGDVDLEAYLRENGRRRQTKPMRNSQQTTDVPLV